MESCTHVFQISGIKVRDKKRLLVQRIRQLGGIYIGGSVYQQASTHLIIPQVLSSEKFLAACAAGKWVVTPEYVLNSFKNGSWLAEGPYEVAISTGATSSFYPVRQWREKVASGRLAGAFQGWRVLLMVHEPTRRAMFKRLLKAGRAQVYHCPPPSHASVTHVMAKPITEDSKYHNAPCYPVSHIVQHLFGSNCVDMNFNITDDHPAKTKKISIVDVDFSKLETELLDYVIKQEGRPRLRFLEFLGYHDPYRPLSQATETDFSNVGSMIECGLFIEALDSIRSAVFPGLLPPAPYLVSLLDYAQQGNATSVFLKNLQQVMYNLLVTNPPWLAPNTVKKYFTQVLQCPRCKTGLWPFLETAISYCLSIDVSCHPLPGPALPTLLHFHSDILAFFLKLFQGELHSVTTGDFVLPDGSGVSQASVSGSLLHGTFWTVWERATLLSRAVKQLAQLLVQAVIEDYAEKQKLHLADTLLDLLSVLVEFWCQQHFKLNQNLVEKGLKDLAEHFAVISQDVSPVVVAELVVRIRSTRLKLVIADATFKSLCCRNGFTVGDEPLSFKKMVLSYLPALGSLAQSPTCALIRTGPTSHSGTSQGAGCSALSSMENETSKENVIIPRGLNRVNAAGETLLHRACKRNQVETVLRILALPGTDINVKDHSGWTPLHEACNHGSTACVEVLLRHRPAPFLNKQVGGVSPLHDSVLNGHMDIAKILLEHAGSVLLQQTDGNGHTALDLVSATSRREELLHSAHVGDSALRNYSTEVLNLPLLEAGSSLLAHLVSSYQQERGLPGHAQPSDKSRSLSYRLVRTLETHSHQKVTLGWTDQRAVRLVSDAETLLELGRGSYLGEVSQAVKECKVENTLFLMEILEGLKSRGEALLADL
ncbi:SMC5-SMC6 complex localization factor protein 1 [Cottoperca gobio]|uniref:SMC5-SMC6 complex localization factor protein 1 n=1 Tax=Cottoperca gobio TaxID=56716 RepID=A0A6J2QFD0_COTGO|nr:SMC5-SMC6 complex localization factor protein 1 [Cottoperca gobio]XP_029295968.1 SMC5-SMC6 complex localization factor protein 1 [Cottoperca gobio]XP_029295969.1 SMC5-SMC6 complex localization factor protein 1 [Cottoperca gobio]XP_029295970.1 SMC5-SMC6 complex localization factor protein 1 [Cottoperca gobio]